MFEFLSEFAVAVTVLLQGPTTEINSKTALQPWCSLYGPGVSLYKHITCYVKIYLTFCSTQPSYRSKCAFISIFNISFKYTKHDHQYEVKILQFVKCTVMDRMDFPVCLKVLHNRM